MQRDYHNRRQGDSIVLARGRMHRLYQQEIRQQKQAAINYSHQKLVDLTKDATKFRQRR